MRIAAQIAVLVIAAVYICAGKVLALVLVPVGMATGWPRVLWPWDNLKEPDGVSYANDHWYTRQHWSWRVSPRFAEYWWRAVRNGFSNGARYAVQPSAPRDIIRSGHMGGVKGPASDAFAGPPPYPKTLWRYEYDRRRWWLARFVFTWFVTEARYFQFYAGFKFERAEGFGISFRCWVYRNEGQQ